MTPYYLNHTNDKKITNLICIIKFGKFVGVIVRLKKDDSNKSFNYLVF